MREEEDHEWDGPPSWQPRSSHLHPVIARVRHKDVSGLVVDVQPLGTVELSGRAALAANRPQERHLGIAVDDQRVRPLI